MSKVDDSAGDSGTEAMHEAFATIQRVCSDVEKTLSELPPSLTEDNFLKEGFFCLRLGMTYYAEANRAVQAKAWFAATAVGTAALEATLLAKCLLQADEVRQLPKYRTFKAKKQRDFRHFVEQLDLGKLLDIADQLSWFPQGGFPSRFSDFLLQHLSMKEVKDILEPFNLEENVGKFCADELRKCRNLLHPAVCLKQGQEPTPELGLVGTFLLLTAISVLSGGQSQG